MATAPCDDDDDSDDNNYKLSPSSSSTYYYDDVLCPSVGSLISRSAMKALYRSIDDATHPDHTAEAMIPFIHLDIESSIHLSNLLPTALHHIETNDILGKLVWEATDIQHIDPAVLSKVIMLPIKRSLFDTDEIWEYQLKLMTDK